ncbi:hypothetical protein OHT93_11635 [Streptomyces sp. NBC_00191]|uniref:glycine-rich domain-containing protein n=1 Tax=Streptomyces sp. NBC_00191 TaxID=2975674 RepID=UPI0032546611
MTVELIRTAGTTDPATLVAPEVMERLIARVVKDYPRLDRVTARRVVAQTAAFIATSAHRPGVDLSPSKLVDIGWHTWIFHTVEYARFCEQVCGRFIHHVPAPNGEELDLSPTAARERTLAAITHAGFPGTFSGPAGGIAFSAPSDDHVRRSGWCQRGHAGFQDR